MHNKSLFIACGAGLLLRLATLTGFASPEESGESLTALGNQAASKDTNVASRAIAALRAKGPDGLEALLLVNSEMIRAHESGIVPATAANQQPAWDRLCAALDQVSGQRDCHASHLYWYTDFEQARAAARATGKPIVSLRMLGRLDEEYSCANSRFFRTTLYANAEISQYLREHFILHWKSVRPVPRITVDFGDGRKIERTITGNSIHYILDPEGNVIDALPGLYGPAAFLRSLKTAEKEALVYAKDNPTERDFHLRQYHASLNADARASCMSDLARIQSAPPRPSGSAVGNPTAIAAGARAVGKFQVERPLLKSMQEINDEEWRKIGDLHPEDAALDAASRRLIATKAPSTGEAGRLTVSKIRLESPLLRMIRNLQGSIAEDTARNEYLLHARLHEWFADNLAPKNLEQLNAKVYAELFLTPDSDPWLGLVPPDTFSGLDNNGLVLPTR